LRQVTLQPAPPPRYSTGRHVPRLPVICRRRATPPFIG